MPSFYSCCVSSNENRSHKQALNRAFKLCTLALAGLILAACAGEEPPTDSSSAASSYTQAHNRQVLAELPASEAGLAEDLVDASRGLIAREERLQIHNAEGRAIWDMPAYNFLQGEAPATVNPSLWRQAKLNNQHGLYQVAEGIYQLRGYDLANMTLISGDTGWIVVDPLTAEETAAAALAFANAQLGERPVSAVIYTHSHIDHFGGVLGVVPEHRRDGSLPIIAPEGFMEEATSENLIAGMAMGRRADLMYGKYLSRSAEGHVDSGLGKHPALGKVGLLPPTISVGADTERLLIDGVAFDFLYTPGTEAPAEFVFYLPKWKAFCGAELVSRTLHNLYTLRGAKVRDALAWTAAIEQSRRQFAEAEMYFGSHHWPLWGRERVQDFLAVQRDSYKYIHDQTVRGFNAGLNAAEIAEQLQWPEALRRGYSNRDYYGTLRHNVKAVYQHYLGWYDAHPANLNPHPPLPLAQRYVDALGGLAAVVDKAEQAFAAGDYRWAAELLKHAVFAEPDSLAAKQLLAKSFDQLGFQAESAPWRDVYLSAAHELREGTPTEGVDTSLVQGTLVYAKPAFLFESMAVRLNPAKADGMRLQVKLRFTDIEEQVLLRMENSVLHHDILSWGDEAAADVVLSLPWTLWIDMALGNAGLRDTVFSDALNIDGSRVALLRFLSAFDQPKGDFSIVTP